MSPIHCRTDGHMDCPFCFAEREVIVMITINRETKNSRKEGEKNA